MKQYEIGMLVQSKSGHDHGQFYVIMDMQDEYVFLVDGKVRTLEHPKKKRTKHVQMTNTVFSNIVEKRNENVLIDEDIKRAIKLHEKVKSIN